MNLPVLWRFATLLLMGCSLGMSEDDTMGPIFNREPPNRVDFSNTTGAVVECSARGNPTPDIIWIRADGSAVGDVPGLRQVMPNGNLVFPPFRAEDYRQEVHAQVYVCLAKNSVGSIHSRDVNVRAVVHQFYQSRVIDEFVLRGNTATLKCLVPSFVADFVEVVEWVADDGSRFSISAGNSYVVNQYYEAQVYDVFVIKGNTAVFKCNIPSFVSDYVEIISWEDTQGTRYLPPTDYDGKYIVLPSGELHIRDVGPEDGYKSYQCRTKHRLSGETRLSATKGRLVITEPQTSVAPKVKESHVSSVRMAAQLKMTVVITCMVQGFPLPSFRWYKYIDGTTRKQPVILDERVKQVSGTLIIKEAKVDDSGKYLCVVNNSVGGESVETVLTVTAPLAASVEPQTQTVDFGRPATFKCNFEGNPIKTISWLKDGKPLNHKEPILTIESVKKEDKGMYQCFIRNDQESAEASAELKLGGRFEPPQLRYSFPEDTLQPGPSVFLKCIASGNPTPEITWELDGKKLSNSDRLQVGQYVTVNGDVVSHLNISSTHTNDGGLYKCIASSKVGSVEHSNRLNIYGLPFIRPMEKKAIVAGETLIVTCPVAGYPIESIVWERDGRVLPINRKQKVFPNGTLIIENVERLSDQATYTCVARNSQGYSARGTLEVQVMVPPQILPFSFGDTPGNAGDMSVVQCAVTKGDYPITITWFFNDAEISPGHQGIAIGKMSHRISALSIEALQARHSGTYTCRATNTAGVTNHSAVLNVNVPPRWILEPTDKAFAQGSDAKVECKADGFPKPQVTWKKAAGDTPGDYNDLKPNNPNIRVEDGTLSINNIQKTNEGYYLCEAVNGIGSGLSAVILISVQAPPHFEIKLRNQTSRRGEPAVLQCEARGEKPIGILWNMNNKRLDPKSDNNRYTIREEILPNGVLSDLSIKRTEREDSALFTCVATNAFGSDDTSINMIVQEVPEVPDGLKVLDKSGRSVQLSWAAPYDGKSPIKRYLIEFKHAKGTWENDIDRVLVPGQQTVAGVFNLKPATTYHLRIVAENDIGTSDPSDTVTIITAEEVPSGPPMNVKVEAEGQHTLKILWKPPERDQWNGEILGYYVGYKAASADTPYLFETVEFSKEEGKEHHLQITDLKTYTQYAVVVQAFNKVGAGPMSEEVRQYTAEGIPEQPPQDTTCTTLTSQTIRVSWVSPPLSTVNGVIKGYKVIYGPSDSWYDDNTKDTKITSASETILHGLKKYTNYSMQVLAYTSGGDGVRSPPIHCQTEQDVPEAPNAVKALVMSSESILVSWKPPEQPNGIVTQYTVYVKEDSEAAKEEEPKSQKVPQHQMSYEASGLKKKEQYEFWVTASTIIGEGQPSKPVSLSPSPRVPAKIASFDDNFTATYKEDVKLPCLAVGIPPPEVVWKVKGLAFQPDDRIRQLPEGSLFITSVTRQDAGEYTCTVENSFGQDTVTHRLVVHAPPHKPQVTLTSTTTNSITIKLRPHPTDNAPLHGYTIHYKPEFGEWETVQAGSQTQTFTIENLWCGSRYQVYVTAYNGIGTGDASDILNTKTKGAKPGIPEASRFIEVSSGSITLHLSAWSDGGCPMLYFVVEHKKKSQTEWNQVSNNVKPGGNFVVLDLDPATWYHLRVTAHNNAGFAVAEYEFATLTVTGGTIAPAREIPEPGADFPIHILLSNLNLVVPVAAAILVIIIAIIVICVLRGKSTHHKDDVVYNQSAGGNTTVDKRRPDLRDELGYIAPPNRKLPPVPGSNYNTCDRIKRGHPGSFRSHATWDPRHPRHMYEELSLHPPGSGIRKFSGHPGSDEALYSRAGGMEDEICPYATFHLLGFREEMDPNKAMQFQTFPHQNGHERAHSGTIGPMGPGSMAGNGHIHQRTGSQSMPRTNGRYSRVNSQNGPGSNFSPGPEYDDPANCGTEEDQYGSQYGQYGAPYDHYGSRGSVSRRSVGSARNLPMSGSPEPPPPPPRNHDPNNSSFNDSKESNEISEAECDRDQLVNRNYGVSVRAHNKDMTTEEMRKLIERNEAGHHQQNGFAVTPYDTVAV
ncbi:Down syndrome cell adhesion molecule-like protein Dscam2 [Schistocerca piceifrons]|uniref:Down syndrome cell adhesion molecule-like protein Dscam2 n=1 Tax=Schistocerca piceifrons TaxID=274613 RepID=UPI001F5FAD6E|nr:Down syndrome cell adhesion molecule-like protein Dscam2 [Schistocerca piceifrons]